MAQSNLTTTNDEAVLITAALLMAFGTTSAALASGTAPIGGTPIYQRRYQAHI
jgi:hypothetical protein